MTVFVVDLSHYDGSVSEAEIRSWLTLGVVGVTHKIGEGGGNDDPLDGTVLARARDAGMPALGGYFIPHQGLDPIAEADRCIALADRDEPWWRKHPGWFWQADCERWSNTDQVTLAEIAPFCDRLTQRTGRRVIVYASAGQYGARLAGLGYPLWNARYGANPAAPFRSAYSMAGGDFGPGWAQYSGQAPMLWQFGSRTTVGTTTTTDCSAYRGTAAGLLEWIKGDTIMALTGEDIQHTWHNVVELDPAGKPKVGGRSATGILLALESRLSALESAVTALGTPLPPVAQGAVVTDPLLAAALRAAADKLDPPTTGV